MRIREKKYEQSIYEKIPRISGQPQPFLSKNQRSGTHRGRKPSSLQRTNRGFWPAMFVVQIIHVIYMIHYIYIQYIYIYICLILIGFRMIQMALGFIKGPHNNLVDYKSQWTKQRAVPTESPVFGQKTQRWPLPRQGSLGNNQVSPG